MKKGIGWRDPKVHGGWCTMGLWMPSTSFHIRREHLEHLDAVADEHEQLNNPSQALKWILDDHMENNE